MKKLIEVYREDRIALVEKDGIAYHRFLKNGFTLEKAEEKKPAKKTTTRKKKTVLKKED